MNQQRIAVLAVLLLCSLRAVAGNQTALPNQGRVMWAAFECSTFAGYSDDKREAERLFNVGYRAGKEFFEKAEKGLISEAELRSATPSGVLMVGRGPTVDFRIGRVYEAAMSNAFDRVTKRGADGLPEVDPKKWITDDEVRSILAKGHYDRSNCALIR